MSRITIALSFAAVILTACGGAKESANMATMGVEFSWAQTQACSGEPPAFELSNVPLETKFLDFQMTDLDAPSYNHGGGEVVYDGNGKIAAGAFAYVGPCPPGGESHRYRFVVKALDANKTSILGRGEAIRNFPDR